MKIISRISTVLMLPLLVIAAINYHFDPDYTLRKDYIPELTRELLNQGVSGPVNINSRALKKKWIEKLPYSPELLVLGSSRTLPLNSETFGSRLFFNASLTNCTWQDMYAVLNWFDKKKEVFPREVIICTDQWLFNKNFDEKRWQQNRYDFLEELKQTSLSKKQFPSKWNFQKEWIKELFSVRYFIRSIYYHGKAEYFTAGTGIDSTKTGLLPDGSRYLPDKLTKPSKESLRQRMENYIRTSHDEYFSELSTEQCELFENLLALLQNRHCEVTLFIPPFHPDAAVFYKSNPKTAGIFAADNYLFRIAKEKKLNVIGGTDPAGCQLQTDDFYDAVHLRPSILKTLFAQYNQSDAGE